MWTRSTGSSHESLKNQDLYLPTNNTVHKGSLKILYEFTIQDLTLKSFTAKKSTANIAWAAMVIGSGVERNLSLPWSWHHSILLWKFRELTQQTEILCQFILMGVFKSFLKKGSGNPSNETVVCWILEIILKIDISEWGFNPTCNWVYSFGTNNDKYYLMWLWVPTGLLSHYAS